MRVPCSGFAQPAVPCPATLKHLLYTLLTTAGEPKAVVWSHVTPIRCGVDAWAHHDLRPGAVAAWPTNLGEDKPAWRSTKLSYVVLVPTLYKLPARVCTAVRHASHCSGMFRKRKAASMCLWRA